MIKEKLTCEPSGRTSALKCDMMETTIEYNPLGQARRIVGQELVSIRESVRYGERLPIAEELPVYFTPRILVLPVVKSEKSV